MTQMRRVCSAATIVEPLPPNPSQTISSIRLLLRIRWRSKATGFIVGARGFCEAWDSIRLICLCFYKTHAYQSSRKRSTRAADCNQVSYYTVVFSPDKKLRELTTLYFECLFYGKGHFVGVENIDTIWQGTRCGFTAHSNQPLGKFYDTPALIAGGHLRLVV
jgi:hypothetical protein